MQVDSRFSPQEAEPLVGRGAGRTLPIASRWPRPPRRHARRQGRSPCRPYSRTCGFRVSPRRGKMKMSMSQFLRVLRNNLLHKNHDQRGGLKKKQLKL